MKEAPPSLASTVKTSNAVLTSPIDSPRTFKEVIMVVRIHGSGFGQLDSLLWMLAGEA
jgi:hypothetical protein